MSLSILIPCKSLREGKSRLGGVLCRNDRRALCVLLLHRTLALALALLRSDRVWIITPDPEARAIAGDQGVRAIDDNGSGLNEALRGGRASLVDQTGSRASALVLPIDLPAATPAAVGRVIRPDVDVALAPDEERRGTNVLYLGGRALTTFPFAFGPDSFLAHRSWAELEGLRTSTIEDPLLAFDLDRPEDYDRWQRSAAKAISGRR
jgi:2-phospho-L-lactate/phosphoenolpyruvate guanylyltransferase